MADEGGNGRTGRTGSWPDDVDSILYQLADYHWTVKRSLRAASFSWHETGRDTKVEYLAQLAQLREKEQRVWDAYLAPPNK